MSSRNDPCWCGSGLKWKKCHFPHPRPKTSHTLADHYLKKYGIVLKTPEQIEGIRKACQLTSSILKQTAALAKEGVTTNELNAFAHRLHLEAGAIPACLGYGSPPFPKSICTSLNHVICHGIPNDIPLKKGDFLNIDISAILNGYYGDCSVMVAIDPIDEEKQRVMKASYEALMRSIALLKPGVLICEIGNAIEACAAEYRCTVVDQFVGHGTGLQFHEPPNIPHHFNTLQIPLAAGMTFTIEPMINAGGENGLHRSQRPLDCLHL